MIYEVEGKGGQYELLGLSKGAGTSRGTIPIVVYRCLETGQLYHRTQGDFSERLVALQSIAEPPTLSPPAKDPQDNPGLNQPSRSKP